jgi:hypothetical protein
MNGSTNLDETHISCVEHTEVCVQKDLFNSVDSLHRKIFSTLNVKNRYFILIQSHSLLELTLNRSRFVGLWLKCVLSIGWWLIRCYLVIQKATLIQLVYRNQREPFHSLELMKKVMKSNENVWPITSQGNIWSAINQWKRLIQAVIQENGGPIQHWLC